MIFRLGTEGVEVSKITKDDLRKQYSEMITSEELLNAFVEEKLTTSQYDLIEGREFLDQAESHCIMDDDGVISDVFVDGFISNLGLGYDSLAQRFPPQS